MLFFHYLVVSRWREWWGKNSLEITSDREPFWGGSHQACSLGNTTKHFTFYSRAEKVAEIRATACTYQCKLWDWGFWGWRILLSSYDNNFNNICIHESEFFNYLLSPQVLERMMTSGLFEREPVTESLSEGVLKTMQPRKHNKTLYIWQQGTKSYRD